MVEKISRVKTHQRYYVDGVRVPGATTITGIIAKPALIRWANQMGMKGIDTSKYVEKVADAGTLAHWMVEAHWLGQEVDTDSFTQEQIRLAEHSFLSYLEWEKGKDIEVFEVEKQLVSKKFCYGGTLDCICKIDGVLTVQDLKTSKRLYDEHFYQVAGYWNLARENGYPKVKTIRVLQIGRGEDENWTERVVTGEELILYWHAFWAACRLYHAMKEARKK
jgi:hypothetical protein